MGMIKKQSVVALVLLLLIPLVLTLGGMLFNLINPEIAAGHPNYVRNYHLLSLLKNTSFWASVAGVAVLWLLVCFHADIRTTMNIYTTAVPERLRKANRKVVRLLLPTGT